jgi:hypothetical protein
MERDNAHIAVMSCFGWERANRTKNNFVPEPPKGGTAKTW